MNKNKKIVLFLLPIIFLFAVAQTGQYARRIYPIFTTPATPCSEGSVYYHMLNHQFLICKNTGVEEVGSGGSGGAIPIANASTTGRLLNTDWILFNSKQSALGFTPENSANKNTSNGYAGLTSGKVSSAQISELISSIDLTDYSTSSGTGSTAIRSTVSSAATGDLLTWNGNNWINSPPLVFSVFGRSGVVVAQTGDYTAAQVTNAFSKITFNDLNLVSVPSTPAAGLLSIWADSTDKILKTKNDAGVVSSTIIPNTCTGTNKVSAITSAGLVICTTDQTG